jgi:membrane protein DedA with SNARE-associated domain
MKNAIIAAIVAAVISSSGAFAAGEYWGQKEAQYRLRWNDRELARCLMLETANQHARAYSCARFVRAHTSLPDEMVND